MNASTPATPKPPSEAKLVIEVTWPANAETAVLGKVPADELKAAEVIAAAKKFGTVSGVAIIGKKKFTF
jgi:hypothetical protein